MQIHELNEAAAVTSSDYMVVDNGTATRKSKVKDYVDGRVNAITEPMPQRRGTLASGNLNNLNSHEDFGVYYLTGTNSYTNLPDGFTWGYLEIIAGNTAGSVLQRLTSSQGTARRVYASVSWYAWYVEFNNVTDSATYKGLTVTVRRVGRMVSIRVAGTASDTFDANQKYEQLCTLDQKFWPTATDAGTYYAQVSRTRKAQFNISTSGVVQIGYGAVISTDADSPLSGVTLYVSRTYISA